MCAQWQASRGATAHETDDGHRGDDPIELDQFDTSGPLGRWLINRDRANEGKPALRRR
ncbi:MAG: hypothetical protein LC624_06910 [Halobacteriales archaeon]|nr:hypothetical protein [Halobacteriales archaeon]